MSDLSNDWSEYEIAEAFDGLNQSYIDMAEKLSKVAPRCHFRPMSLECGDGEYSVDSWWECDVCGHTKPSYR
jgi:hypothetical protein